MAGNHSTSNPNDVDRTMPSDPEAQKEAEALELFDKLDAETEPLLRLDDLDPLEARWSETRLTRRLALGCMSKTFHDLHNEVKTNQTFAESVAQVSVCLKNAEFYRELADLMEVTATRLNFALCVRDDMEELLAEAKEAVSAS